MNRHIKLQTLCLQRYCTHHKAEIVETTFVVSRFSDVRKETTRNDPRLVSYLPGTKVSSKKRWSFKRTTRNNMRIRKQNKRETTTIRPYFGNPKVVSTISAIKGSTHYKTYIKTAQKIFVCVSVGVFF